MDVMSIPFTKTVGIKRNSAGKLILPCAKIVHNHLGTIHASAQFGLAETSSGDALQAFFPELIGRVVPLLRESTVKFRNPATTDIYASASISERSVTHFKEQLERKGRAMIEVDVKLMDAKGSITSTGQFNWLIQEIPVE